MNNDKPLKDNFKIFPSKFKKSEEKNSFEKEEIKIYNTKRNLKILEREELSTEKAMKNEMDTKERKKKIVG